MSSSPATDLAWGSAGAKVRAFVKAAAGRRLDAFFAPQGMMTWVIDRGRAAEGLQAPAAAPGLPLVARLVTGVGVIGGFDFRRRDLVDVRHRRRSRSASSGSGGRVDGLVALLVALGLVPIGVAGALLGEV